MSFSMSGGAWSYNRFDLYEKKKAAKDYDGDGKVESSKDEYFGSKDKAIKKAMGKDTKKESKDDCDCKHEDVSITKDDVLGYLMDEGFANNVVSAEVIFDAISDDFLCAIEEQIEEGYKGKHGMTDQQYMDGRSPAGKQISGDSKGSGANYSYRAKNTGPNKPGMKPQGQARMNNKDRSDLAFRKLALKKASNN